MIDLLVATRSGAPALEPSDALLAALDEQGLRHEARPWDDPEVDWSEGRLCLLARPGDSGAGAAPLLEWARSAGRATRLVNPLEGLEWSLDRHHLLRLEEADVPTLPTLWLEGGGPADLAFQLDMVGWSGAFAQNVRGRSRPALVIDLQEAGSLERASARLDGLLAEGDVILQPLLPHLATEGVRSLVFVAGEFSHAVQRPARADRVPRRSAEGACRPVDVDGAELAAGRDACAAVPGEPAWTRVDVVRDMDGEVCVVGVELVELDLDFEYGEGAAQRLAEHLGRLARA